MPIYEKPTKALMHDFSKEMLKPGQIFEKNDAVSWFTKRYPNIKSNTVEMHVEGMSVNSPQRKHHPSIKPGSGHDLFFKLGRGNFRLWDKAHDPAPFYKGQVVADEPVQNPSADAADEESYDGESGGEFAFERDLRNYIAKNLGLIEAGLKVYEDEEFTGIEFPVGGRYIDILAVDSHGDFIVIELKVSRGYDRTIGQILRYMAWVKQKLAKDRKVSGLIVASEISEDLKLAVSLVPNVRLAEYELSMKLRHLSQ